MPVSSFKNVFDKAKTASDFSPLEPGTYNFVIAEAPEVDLDDQIIKGKAKVEDGPRANYNVFLNLSFNENHHEMRLKSALDTVLGIGFSEDDFIALNSLQELATMLHGKRFVAEVVHGKNKTDPTKPYVNLKNVRPADGASAGPGPGPGGPGLSATPPPPPGPQQGYPQQAPPQQQAPQQGYPQQGQQQGYPPQQAPQQNYQQPPAPAPQQGQPNVWDSVPQDQSQQQPPATQHGAPPPPPLMG